MISIKNFLLGSIFFALSSTAVAQTGSVKGAILSYEGEEIIDANIYLNDSNWAVSDENGEFEIHSIPGGQYTLTVSRIGFQTYDKTILINPNETLTVTIQLSPEIYQGSTAVVTATRSSQDIESVPISVDVISEDEIQRSGSTSLRDILLEQAGISLSPNEDNAIQIQGFESDYTLILVDGQPLIGRIRGALDVSRINVANIQQVEVVKGPSSALWGSDALAGVINIITKKSPKKVSGNIFSEIGSRTSYNSGASVSFNQKIISGRAGFSFDGSDGFDLSKEEFGNNQNPYDNITLNTSLSAQISDVSTVSLSGRYFKNNFSGQSLATVQGEEIGVDEDGWQNDLSFQLRFETSPFSRFNSATSVYTTRYEDYSETLFEDPTEEDIINNNKQGYDKIELQNNYNWINNHISTFGAGLTKEFVDAQRFQGRQKQHGSFFFAQHQFVFWDKLNLTAGARLDKHSSYNSYLSPKLSLKFDALENLSFRASVGQGFKAPDLRTLYLNFVNAGSGYRLYGVSNIGAELSNFESQNLVQNYLIDPSEITSLDPEYSTAYNVGLSYKAFSQKVSGKVNFFRNNAQNLIEALEVAELTDGSSIYGYVNINKARTQGVEADQTYFLTDALQISLGYQYLDAVELVKEPRTVIEDGKVVTKNVEISVPLPKRPLHSGTIKLFYKEPFLGTDISIRGQLRSSYFYSDSNVNGKADSNEFADGYSIWNLSVSKQFRKKIRALIGVNNLFNHTDPEFLRYQPETTFFTKILFEF